MNTKIIELKEKRSALLDALSAITAKAEAEKRSVNADEITNFDKINGEIKDLDVQLRIAERQLEVDKEKAGHQMKRNVSTPEEKLAKNFDLFGAIRSRLSGRQMEGANAEICQEGIKELSDQALPYDARGIQIPSNLIKGMQLSKRAEIGTGDGAPPIPVIPDNFLDIVKTPSLLERLNVTYWPGLTGNVPLPRMDQLAAAVANEKSAVGAAGVALAKNTLTPRRFGSTETFTKELLSQTSPQIQADIWQAFIDAIWVNVQKDLMQNVAAGATSITGYLIATAPAVLDWAAVLKMEAAIENEFDGMYYTMSHGQKALLKAKEKASNTAKFVFEDNMVNGYGAYGTASLAATNGGSTNTAFDVLFGYWKAAVIGSWGGIELIVDPYTSKNKGEIEVTASGLFDTDIRNPKRFSAIRNATV